MAGWRLSQFGLFVSTHNKISFSLPCILGTEVKNSWTKSHKFQCQKRLEEINNFESTTMTKKMSTDHNRSPLGYSIRLDGQPRQPQMDFVILNSNRCMFWSIPCLVRCPHVWSQVTHIFRLKPPSRTVGKYFSGYSRDEYREPHLVAWGPNTPTDTRSQALAASHSSHSKHGQKRRRSWWGGWGKLQESAIYLQ